MSDSKTKTESGRHSFEGQVALKITDQFGNVTTNRSGRDRYILARNGVVTFTPYSRPGWRELIRNHQDATTMMVGNRIKVKTDQCSFDQTTFFNGRTTSWKGSQDTFMDFGTFPTVIGGDPSAVARASEKFIKSMQDATHEMRGASVLAEASEAIRMLASPAKALRLEVGNLYQTARRRMYRDRNNSLRAQRDVVAGTWLEWNFGIKPLVSDANAAADALNQLRTRELQSVFPIKGFSRDEKLVSQDLDRNFSCAALTGGGSTIIGSYCKRVVDWQECTFRGSLVLDVGPGKDVPLSAQFGVGFEDLAPAIWEAFPWSWFYDYFFNCSAVIDAWSAPLRNVRWMNRTVRNGRTHFYDNLKAPRNTVGPGSAYANYYLSPGHAEATLLNITRSSVNPLDLSVPFRMKLPGHGTQWANLAALASYGVDLRGYRRFLRNIS